MAIQVQTKDCAALGDANFAEMADLVAPTTGWEVGTISKQAEEWVLASLATDRDKLQGFMMMTLERIGGTPALVIGIASVARSKQRPAILKGLMNEAYHKALMAFPDEDVIVASRLVDTGPLEAFADLTDVRPWPDTRVNGEERAWGRRLSKRFGSVSFDDRTMLACGDGDHFIFDHESPKPIAGADAFEECEGGSDQYVIAWGWAMAEFLETFR